MQFITDGVMGGRSTGKLIIEDYQDKKLDLIDKTLIDNNLYDSLASISSIDKISLLGFFEDGKIGFIDSLGNTILKISDRKYSLDVICSFIDSDFFVVEEKEIKI